MLSTLPDMHSQLPCMHSSPQHCLPSTLQCMQHSAHGGCSLFVIVWTMPHYTHKCCSLPAFL